METIAQKIINKGLDYGLTMVAIGNEDYEENQDWKNEETTFIFSDGSAIKFHNDEFGIVE